MRKCSILGCSNPKCNIKVTFFYVTKANKLSWETPVCSSISTKVKNLQYICSEHFLHDDICITYHIPTDVIEVRK